MKKFLLLFMVSLFTIFAHAAVGDIFIYEGIRYEIVSEEDHQVGVSNNYNVTGDISIPSLVSYGSSQYKVVNIGSEAFQDCIGLISVIIPNSVTSIGKSAFSNCSSLTSVTIPNSVTEIDMFAFSRCSSLTSVTIPKSVVRIGFFAFSSCSSMTDIIVEEGNENYCSENGMLFDFDKTTLIQCPGAKKDIEIPNSVTSIENSAFSNCVSLTSVSIPNSVTSIGSSAFESCISLTSVSIPNTVTSIGNRAFENCISLTSVTIPDSVTSLGNNAFYRCSNLISVIISNSLTSIDTSTFARCSSLISVIVPNSVTSIGIDAFYRCNSLSSITIPNSVNYIGRKAFGFCSSLTSVTIPDSVTSIDDWTFYNCSSLTSVKFPNSVTSIGDKALYGCTSLTSVKIPNSVTSIGDEAFRDCTSLTSIIIPNAVTSIGDEAFYNCNELVKIVNLNNTPQKVGKNAFYNLPRTAIMYIPNGSLDDYMTADDWMQIPDLIEMGVLDLSLSVNELKLKKGETAVITATVEKDSDISIESEEWSTSNPEVATVVNGKVTAVANGKAVISYTVTDDYGVPHTEYCTVIVSATDIFVESIALDRTSIEAEVGAEIQLIATVTPDNAINKEIAWSSSDKTVATVSAEGLVKIIKEGNCVITAATTDGSNLKAECSVSALAGIEEIFNDANVKVDVYTLQGVMVICNTTLAEVNNLPAGIYIVRQGNVAKKVVVK